jgi:hypothetical protein
VVRLRFAVPVIAVLSALLFFSGKPSAQAIAARVAPGDSVRPVLEQERFPWYDAKSARVKPLLPWFDPQFQWLEDLGNWLSRRFEGIRRWFRWLNGWRVPVIGTGMGDVIAIGLVLLFLTLVLVLLLELLRRYRPVLAEKDARAAAIRAGSAQRIEGLPAGAGFDAADPWAEAKRRRASGDLAGAVVYLFAHQLLALHRVQQIRIVPGRTGRQLVRSVSDRELRRHVEPTLRLFEAVYYGHLAPSADAFESVWRHAEEFEQLLAVEVHP